MPAGYLPLLLCVYVLVQASRPGYKLVWGWPVFVVEWLFFMFGISAVPPPPPRFSMLLDTPEILSHPQPQGKACTTYFVVQQSQSLDAVPYHMTTTALKWDPVLSRGGAGPVQ